MGLQPQTCIRGGVGGLAFYPSARRLHPDVIDYAAKINSNSGSVTYDQLKAVSDFVRRLELDEPALLTILRAGRFNPFLGTPAATGALNAAMVPLYTGVGPALDVPTALVDADVTATGILGNGSTKFISTGTNNNVFAQNNQALGVFVTGAQTTDATYFGAGSANTGASGITTNGSTSYGSRSQQSTGDFAVSAPAATATGFFAIRREASANYQRIWGMVEDSTTITRASQTPRSDTLCVFRGGLESSVFSNGRAGAYLACAGAGWTLTAFRPIINRLMIDLGRWSA